eukprot:IDg1281t1
MVGACGLAVEDTAYAHCRSQNMIYPTVFDWQVLLSEYCIQATVAWLTALFKDFRMFCLSPRLGEMSETLSDAVAKALGGMQNLADLSSLARVHNRVCWASAHPNCRFKSPFVRLGLYHRSHARVLTFDPWARVFLREACQAASERLPTY